MSLGFAKINKFADAYFMRGSAYEKKGDKSLAEADFAQAKKLGYKEGAVK